MSTNLDYDSGIPRSHRWLGESGRSNYIPAWYEPHKNLELEVRHLGLGQGFPISRVLPYRRWAIDQEGNTLDQKDFEAQYMQYISAFRFDSSHDPRNEAIPNVRAFVRMKHDRVGSLVDMDYEDDGSVQKTEKYTRDGDIAPEFLAKSAEQAGQISKMALLADLAKDGLLTPVQFQAKVAEILGNDEADGDVGEPAMIAAPPRRAGRPKGSKNKPKPPDFAAA